jgi:hypothetical protein
MWHCAARAFGAVRCRTHQLRHHGGGRPHFFCVRPARAATTLHAGTAFLPGGAECAAEHVHNGVSSGQPFGRAKLVYEELVAAALAARAARAARPAVSTSTSSAAALAAAATDAAKAAAKTASATSAAAKTATAKPATTFLQ